MRTYHLTDAEVAHIVKRRTLSAEDNRMVDDLVDDLAARDVPLEDTNVVPFGLVSVG